MIHWIFVHCTEDNSCEMCVTICCPNVITSDRDNFAWLGRVTIHFFKKVTFTYSSHSRKPTWKPTGLLFNHLLYNEHWIFSFYLNQTNLFYLEYMWFSPLPLFLLNPSFPKTFFVSRNPTVVYKWNYVLKPMYAKPHGVFRMFLWYFTLLGFGKIIQSTSILFFLALLLKEKSLVS